MKVLIIGASGLLGSQAAWELHQRGHKVLGFSLPPLPEKAVFPPGMEQHFGNYLEISDEDLLTLMTGCEGLVFAAGVDERVRAKAPVAEFFRKYNNAPLKRILTLAKQAGIRHSVVLGSYFVHFNREWPEYALETHHPYIKTRVEQEALALGFAGDGFDVAVLELPYIFGTQPGRKPVWVFLVKMLQGMKPFTLYPRGGSAMVTVKQVGQAIAGALERNRGGQAYPIGYENRTWRELLTLFHQEMGCPNKRIITIPTFLFALGTRSLRRKDRREGYEGGLDLPRFAPAMASNAFIDKSLGSMPLGVEADNLDQAIRASVRQSVFALENETGMLGMPDK